MNSQASKSNKKVAPIVIALLLALFAIALITMITRQSNTPVFATQEEDGTFVYNGATYYAMNDLGKVYTYKQDVSLGRVEGINTCLFSTIQNDPENQYLLCRGIRDGLFYLKDQKPIPTKGTVTAVYIGDVFINTEQVISAITALSSASGERASFQNQGCGRFTADICYCYDDCPIGIYEGTRRIAHKENQWIYVDHFDSDAKEENQGFVVKDEGIIAVLEALAEKIEPWHT